MHNFYNISYSENIDKIIKTKGLYTQYVINKYYNQSNLLLSSDDLFRLRHISRLCHKYRFVDVSGEISNQKGHIVSSDILQTIRDFLDDDSNVTIISVHDTTLFSLASIFGIDIEMPSFNGTFIIEDYGDKIGFKYNHNPTRYDIANTLPKIWEKDRYYVDYQDLNTGYFERDEFFKILTL